MLKCPSGYVLLSINSKFKDKGNEGLVIDTDWDPGEYATVTGMVSGVSDGCGLKVGEEVCFSYRVVYNRSYSDNKDDVFSEDVLTNPWVTSWSNKSGLKILRRNLKGGKFDAVLYMEKEDVLCKLDFIEGSLAVVKEKIESWQVSHNDTIAYKNLVDINGKEYWRVKENEIYGVKRGEKIECLGKYLLLESEGVDRQKYTGGLELWGSYRVKEQKVLCMKVASINKGIDVKEGDMVFFDKDYAPEYEFWGKKYVLLREDQVLAKLELN